MNDVTSLTGVQSDQLLHELVLLLGSYPEASFNDRYVHYMVYERGMKWSFEGEDRNRSFFWAETPFYSLPFFVPAMQIPSVNKRYHRLYRLFLTYISQAASDVPDAARRLAVSSPKFRYRLMVASFLSSYPQLAKFVRRGLSRTGTRKAESKYVQCLKVHMSDRRSDYSMLKSSAIAEIVEKSDHYTPFAIDTLLLMCIFVELCEGRSTSLERMSSIHFE